VVEVRRQITGRNRVEVVVVAVDPVDPRARRLVRTRSGRDVANTEPERDVGMACDDGARRVERAVDVAENPERYFVAWAGMSRSILSQMKSLLL
jgi:hypothetical protein